MPPLRKPGTKGRTKVTFSLPRDVSAEEIAICGDFNDWSPTPMKKYKDGHFAVTIDLVGGSYRYRFLVDGQRWENDWEAEQYLPNPYGGEDSVVTVDGA